MKLKHLSILVFISTACGPISVEIPNATVNAPAGTGGTRASGIVNTTPSPSPLTTCDQNVVSTATPTPTPTAAAPIFDPNDPYTGTYPAATLTLTMDVCGGTCAQTVDMPTVVVTGDIRSQYVINGDRYATTKVFTTSLQWQVVSGTQTCASDRITETFTVAHDLNSHQSRTYIRTETGNCQSDRYDCECRYSL